MSEILQTLCGILFGLLVFIGFLVMFGWAAFKGELIFNSGRIRGKPARVIGVIGLLGTTAGVYLAISLLVFHTEPPFESVTGFFVLLTFAIMLVLRFLSIFFWHSK